MPQSLPLKRVAMGLLALGGLLLVGLVRTHWVSMSSGFSGQTRDYSADANIGNLLLSFTNHSLVVPRPARSANRLGNETEIEHNRQLRVVSKGDGHHLEEELWHNYEHAKLLQPPTSTEQGPVLPALSATFNQDDERQLEASQKYLFEIDRLHGHYTVADVGLMALVAKSHTMVYSDLFTHRYDNYQVQRQANGHSVDNERCIAQLESLARRAAVLAKAKYRSRDVNLYQLFDTWVHLSSGLLIGNAFMEGMYNECLRLKIEMPPELGGPQVATRYCVVSVKHVDWPKIDKFDVLNIKGGICIPQQCDSANYKTKFKLLLELLEFQLRDLERGQIRIQNLYCLPDEDSPLRSISSSTLAAGTLAGLLAWILLLLYCTHKHSRTEANGAGSGASSKNFGLTNMNAGRKDEETEPAAVRVPALRPKLYEMLSITNNFRLLFATDKESDLIKAGEKLKRAKSSDQERELEQQKHQADTKIVDLGCIEGVKVIAMCYVIMGHVLMCMTSIMYNGRETAGSFSVSFFVANLVPAFAVNSFFTITGLLTCYMILKQNKSFPLIASPSKWLAFILYRYLRIMPLYALVVLYCKSLAKFTGSGPLWDYATSSLGQRRLCEREPWLSTFLFRANFEHPLEQCVVTSWYLANDFQFFLVTPLLMNALHRWPKAGPRLLYLGVVAGYLAGFYSIFGSQVDDLRPIANFAPHGFKTYVAHFSHNYTRPYYRIPAYLIGLLIGHNLFLYEQAKLEHRARQASTGRAAEAGPSTSTGINGSGANSDAHRDGQAAALREPDWSDGFKRYAIPVSLGLVALCCVTPVIGALLPFNRTGARFMVALITPSYHVMFALAVGLYLLLATTGSGYQVLNRLLSARFWKPLARLSLCAVLVNVEVTNYIMQSNTNLHYWNNQYHSAMNCICILSTYLVSVVVCVLFEAPIRASLNALLTYAIVVGAAKQRRRVKAD